MGIRVWGLRNRFSCLTVSCKHADLYDAHHTALHGRAVRQRFSFSTLHFSFAVLRLQRVQGRQLYNIDLRKEHQRLSTPLSFRMKFSLTQLGICSTIGGDGPSDGEFGPGSD